MALYINRQAPQSGISSLLAQRGRMGDTELVHMTKPEVKRLQQTGLLSLNPQTGLPEYFLGGIFKGIKNTVKSFLKPENLIPAIASIALPAFGGSFLQGLTGLSQLASSSILSGAGTFFGNLPFKSVEDSATAGLLAGGTRYGMGKIGQMMGPSDKQAEALFKKQYPGTNKETYANYKKRLNFENQGTLENQLLLDNGGYDDDIDNFTSINDAIEYKRMNPRPEFVTPMEIKTSQSAALDAQPGILTDKAFVTGSFNEAQALEQAQRFAMSQNKLLSDPALANKKANVLGGFGGKTITPDQQTMNQVSDPYYETKQLMNSKEGAFNLEGLKSLNVGEILASGGAGLNATLDAEQQALLREEEEKFLAEQAALGVPRPIARTKYKRLRDKRAPITRQQALAAATKGGGLGFYGPTQYAPIRTAEAGGLVALGHGGRPDFEGMVQGNGHGMEDNVIMDIKQKGGLLAVSPKEYVVPADVMSMLGNGNPDDGANEMDKFIGKFRQTKYGRPTQPPEMDGGTALQSLMKG